MGNNDNNNEENRQMRSRRSKNKNNKKGGLTKVFYIIIGVLVLVLIGLAIFIFTNNSGDSETASENLGQTEQVENEPNNSGEEAGSESSEQSEEQDQNQNSNQSSEENSEESSEESSDSQDENSEEDSEEENSDSQDENSEESSEEENSDSQEDAPLNTDYVPDYSDGSADRQQIASLASQVTGIPQGDMVEEWVGNNGPGRVRAEVRDVNDSSEHYYVYLQYGEGSWHVTDYTGI